MHKAIHFSSMYRLWKLMSSFFKGDERCKLFHSSIWMMLVASCDSSPCAHHYILFSNMNSWSSTPGISISHPVRKNFNFPLFTQKKFLQHKRKCKETFCWILLLCPSKPLVHLYLWHCYSSQTPWLSRSGNLATLMYLTEIISSAHKCRQFFFR